MSDTIQLVPSVPVVPRPAQVRPDQQVEPAKQSQAERRTADNGNGSEPHAEPQSRHLTISRHDTLGIFVYRSIEGGSGEVVWQYPNENKLRMSQKIQELQEQSVHHQVDQKI